MGPFAVTAAAIATLPLACAHGIDTELDLSDGGLSTGQTTGPTVGVGGAAGDSTGSTSGTGGRGDPTGVGGSSGASGASTSTTSTSSAGGIAGSSGAGGSTTGGGAGVDAGAGAAGQGGAAGQAGQGGAGGASGAGGVSGAGGTGGSAVRDAGPLTTFDDAVTGTGTNQFNYVGTWGHCNPCTSTSTPPLHASTNSWAGGADASGTEYVTFAFVGSEIRFYGVKDPRNGIGGVSVDGGAETKVDFYGSARAGDTLLWSSPILAQGTHSFKLRVTSTKNASSTGTTVTVDRVDVR